MEIKLSLICSHLASSLQGHLKREKQKAFSGPSFAEGCLRRWYGCATMKQENASLLCVGCSLPLHANESMWEKLPLSRKCELVLPQTVGGRMKQVGQPNWVHGFELIHCPFWLFLCFLRWAINFYLYEHGVRRHYLELFLDHFEFIVTMEYWRHVACSLGVSKELGKASLWEFRSQMRSIACGVWSDEPSGNHTHLKIRPGLLPAHMMLTS